MHLKTSSCSSLAPTQVGQKRPRDEKVEAQQAVRDFLAAFRKIPASSLSEAELQGQVQQLRARVEAQAEHNPVLREYLAPVAQAH